MDLQTAASLGEALGGLAILISLLYIVIELRRNNRITRASASYMGAHSWAEMNTSVALEGELFDLFIRARNDDELSESERFRVENIYRGMLQRLDGLFYLHNAGLLETELWDARLEWTLRWLETPHIKRWWEAEKLTANYSKKFLAVLAAGKGSSGIVYSWESRDRS